MTRDTKRTPRPAQPARTAEADQDHHVVYVEFRGAQRGKVLLTRTFYRGTEHTPLSRYWKD